MLPAVREPIIGFNPPHYFCRRAPAPLGEPDGRLDKPFWAQAEWINDFHDIEGDSRTRPLKQTRVKMLWDDDNLYIGAQLTDDTIWANIRQRDAVIFYDNDFEVFLSPKDTTHRYYELEMNALNTVWDLLMEKPARDEVRRIIGWDIHGLKSAVHVEGELNNPAADNRFWSLELVIPWFSLRECEVGECWPQKLAPVPGEVWRANFSRVEYRVNVENGRYVKQCDPATGQPWPEYNWVWAPTGVIDIHMPEMWAFLFFAGPDTPETFTLPQEESVKWQLRRLYYRQRNFGAEHGFYTADLGQLLEGGDQPIQAQVYVTPSLFEIVAPRSGGGTLRIRQDGYLWRE